ncbi:BnaC06g18180D [Brassica napus]|uniref:BnaC06g18180D protein n=1 Tax=Brassica napus TaxID=3708 RepID=A0A078GI96_BRANA|nr:BnaC06g18180D [Brassica napus]
MEVLLNSALPNGFFNFSSLSSNSSKRLINKRTQHRFNSPISKFHYHRASILRVSARFREPSRRRNSLRKKIIGDENFRIPSDTGTKTRNETQNLEPSDDVLVELSRKDKILPDSNLLNELEDWVTRYKKEAEFWGIGSNPIFTVYQDSNGNVERVDVDEDEVLRRRSSLEDVDSVRDKVLYAKELAERMENGEDVIRKDSSLVKFVSSSSEKEEVQFVSSIQSAILRLDLVPKLPAIGRASNEVDECSELEKEMMRRKMKAWKEKEVMEKGTVEVLQEKPLVSFEKPKFDREELMSSISKVKGSEKKLNALDSPQVESGESMEFENKIHEIKAMARRAREIEAGIELNEKEKRDVNKETGEDDEGIRMREVADDDDDKDESLGTWTESDQENTELSGLAIPVVNGAIVDSGFPNHEMATSDAEKVSNEVPLAPTEGIIHQSSDVSKDKLSMMNNSTGRKSRVIRSVKEAKEFLSTRSSEEEFTQKMAQDSDEISSKQSDEKRKLARRRKLADKNAGNGTLKSTQGSFANKIGERETSSSGGTEHIEKEQPSLKENWMEKNYHELEPIAEKMRAEKETQEPGTIAEIAEIYRNEDNDELEWMKDEKLRDIVFHVRDNELAGLEKKVEKENEKLSHLHQWIHSNVENLDYGVDGISVYDPPEKVIPRWKGPPPTLEKSPKFLNNYNEQREALFSGKAASVSPPVKKEEQNSLHASSENTLTSSSEVTSSHPKIVVEGSDGSVRPGKKSGKEFWQHTKKWSPGFLELYNAETDPEVKAVMRDMGKDLDRWITEDEIKDVADIMEKLPERNKKFMEKKLNKVKREMELFGPQAVLSKYREYGEDKEEDYLWWLDLPHVLCLELYTVDDKGEQQVGFYTLEMAKDLELEPKPHHVIAFENAADCKNLCYIIQAHLDMLRTGNVFIVPRPPKDTIREAKANGFGVTVIRKGELKLNIDEPLEEVEEQICEIGSKMYHDKIMGDRSVDISSLMKGVFNLKTKPSGRRRERVKRALKDSNKKSS